LNVLLPMAVTATGKGFRELLLLMIAMLVWFLMHLV
jgi:hypothetical protein